VDILERKIGKMRHLERKKDMFIGLCFLLLSAVQKTARIESLDS